MEDGEVARVVQGFSPGSITVHGQLIVMDVQRNSKVEEAPRKSWALTMDKNRHVMSRVDISKWKK